MANTQEQARRQAMADLYVRDHPLTCEEWRNNVRLALVDLILAGRVRYDPATKTVGLMN
jgi:hypothetical protein